MTIAERIPTTRDKILSMRKRQCPDCGNYLFLESVYGEGYWWNCLMCGWSKPVQGMERQDSMNRTR